MNRRQEAQDTAAHWIVAREEPGWTEKEQAKLDAWLAQSDLNRVAFLRLEQSWHEADRIKSLGAAYRPKNLQRRRALSRIAKRWVPLAVAASLIAFVGIGWPEYSGWTDPERENEQYNTVVGGHRNIELPDGSRVELNTATNFRTSVDAARRDVWLDRGEAYFEVAKDESRPFVVHVGNRRVTVLGTKFSVRRDGDKVSVFVREGRVRVDVMQDGKPVVVRSTVITGGEIALTSGTATLVTTQSNERVEGALAWRNGMLRFDQHPISEVAAEFNRYNRQKLVVTDKSAASVRIGGAFPASRPAEFVRLLRDAYGMRIEETPDEIRISN